jgi:hypothetical protein
MDVSLPEPKPLIREMDLCFWWFTSLASSSDKSKDDEYLKAIVSTQVG